MKLKSLEITGFKSFVDRTAMRFDHDITGVVGPNGCGKSNIVDAIRWAMGEQSAKHLRGKHMDDVIFNGSEVRGPHSFAEVTLTFDNNEGKAPAEFAEYSEIAVTRRLTRDGDSTYMINRTPVRLMDVTNLFLGTGVGTKAYSIIEQGRIGLIVTAKPEERRHLIEEAAGITRFKNRKRKAERKMEHTRQNLLRVGDILGELEKSLASLKRQAQKAERYKVYRNEQRDLELWVASHRYLELWGERGVLGARVSSAQAQLEGFRAGLAVVEAEVEVQRLSLQEEERAVEVANSRAYQLENAVRLLETQVQHHIERLEQLRAAEAAAERELAEMTAQRERSQAERAYLSDGLQELEEVEAAEAAVLERESELLEQRKSAASEAEQALTAGRARVGEANTRIARAEAVVAGWERRREEANQRLTRLRDERSSLEIRTGQLQAETRELAARLEGLRGAKQNSAERKAELEQELKALRADVHGSEKRTDGLRSELAEKRSRLRSLEQIHDRFEGVGAGVRALMKSGDRDGIHGLLADRLDCPPEYTQALAGALGERLQYVLVEDFARGAQVVRGLREAGKGRATVIPAAPRPKETSPSPALGLPGVQGCLVDLIRFAAEDEALARNLLSEVLLVDDLEVARRLYDDGAFTGVLVTLDGEVVGRDGRITGGSGDNVGAHLLEVKHEMRELAPVVERLDAELAESTERTSQLREAVAKRQAELDATRSEGHDADIAIVKAEKDLRRGEEEQERAKARAERLSRDADELSESLETAGEEEREAREEIAAAQSALAEAEQDLVGFEQVRAERREAVEAQASVVTEVRVRTAEARQRVQGDRAALERLEKGLAELEQRLERVDQELVDNVQKQGTAAAEVMIDREALGTKVGEAKQADEVLARAREAYDTAKLKLGERDGEIKELRGKIDEVSTHANESTLAARELELAIEHLVEQVEERHRVDVRHTLTDHHDRELPDAAVHDRIKELQRLLDRMGSINLTAIEEYEEQSQRYEYLSNQRADLESALEQLEKAIRQMNRESRKLFRETFGSVAARFEKIFPILFGGGSGQLKLTNPEDMLETGVDIIAQPPGKRLGSMELMSGGEKALTAVALIFALFQHKPSPFCVLDEVDAPLDEANIGRFAEAVRAMTGHSQFIVITHSKRTMEIVDVLYGVTMEQPGVSTLVGVELKSGSQKRSGDVAVA